MAISPGGNLNNFIRDPQTNLSLKFNSFSGTDIQCFFFGDNINVTLDDVLSSTVLSDSDKKFLSQRVSSSYKPIQPFGELQTLTISSARSFGPVRRLGEIEPIQYKGGARTIAGSMVFAVLNRDVFAAYMDRLIPGTEDNEWSGPDFVDEIPAFNILIQGANEYGSFASAILVGVKITNFGTTFSVDDMFTESTYSYVAQRFLPFVDDVQKTIKFFSNQASTRNTDGISQIMMRDSVIVRNIDGRPRRISRQYYEFLQKLPEAARARYMELYDSSYEAYNDEFIDDFTNTKDYDKNL